MNIRFAGHFVTDGIRKHTILDRQPGNNCERGKGTSGGERLGIH